MVKDSSIGIRMERMELIVVGSSVGAVSIFKAEIVPYDVTRRTLTATSTTGRKSLCDVDR